MTRSAKKNSPAAPAPNPGVAATKPYKMGAATIAGQPAAIKLSSNESPFGPSPAVIDAMTRVLNDVNRYPDGTQSVLREAIAEIHELDPAMVVCGNGSEDLIGVLTRAYLSPGDELVLSENHFVMCSIHARTQGADIVVAPERDYHADPDAMLDRVGPRTRMVALANPNNPTGTYLPFDTVRRLHEKLPDSVILLLDGAYAEYVTAADYDAGAGLVESADNVVMTRTFSKIYGLAGLRIGWAYCPPAIVDSIGRVRAPFTANTVAMAAATAAVRDQAHVDALRRHTARWRDTIKDELEGLGLRVLPSQTNFYLILFEGAAGKHAAQAAAALEAAGIAPRPADVSGQGDDALRITIGTDEENEAVLEVLRRYMATRD